MKRIREGFPWPCDMTGMTSKPDPTGGLILIPFDHETGQCFFRFMIEGNKNEKNIKLDKTR